MPTPFTRTPLRLGTVAGLAAPFALVSFAGAEVPSVVDRIPADIAAFVAIPNLQALLADVTAFSAAHADSLPPEVGQGLAQVGMLQLLLSQPGMKADGSAAVVLFPGGGGPEDMDAAAILPITDFAAFRESPFVQGQNAKMTDGVLALDFFGQQVHIRDLGGFAIIGPERGLVSSFDGAKGRMQAHRARLGATGSRLADRTDAMIVANIEALAPALKEGMGQMEQQAQFLAMMGGGAAVTEGFGLVKMVADNFVRDASVGLVGFDISAAGIAVDLAAQFKDESELAGFFAEEGDSGELMSRLPRMDFLMAGAFDSSNPGVKQIMQNLTEFNKQIQAAAAEQMGGEVPTMGFEAFETATGFTGAIGTAPAMGGGGLFANSIAYYALPDPEEAKAELMKGMTAANGTSAAGLKYTTTYQKGAQEIAGLTADTYGVQTQIDPTQQGGGGGMGMMADPAMIQQMMFGFTGGPNGFVVQDNDGLYMTASKNSQLVTRAVGASKGDAPRINDAEGFKKTRSRLFDNPTAEIYIAADQIANTVGPFAVMMGAVEQFEPAPAMAPLGMAVHTGDGGMTLRTFVPGELIGFLAKFAPQDGGDWEIEDQQEAPPF